MASALYTNSLSGGILGSYSSTSLSKKVTQNMGTLTITSARELDQNMVGRIARIAIDLLRKKLKDLGDGDLNLQERLEIAQKSGFLQFSYKHLDGKIAFSFPSKEH